MKEKSLHNTTANGAKENVKDIQFWGDGDTFLLISKASSEAEGWMKSTKAMPAGTSVVVQVTTQQRNPDGSYSITDALTTVENAIIWELIGPDGKAEYRSIVQRTDNGEMRTIKVSNGEIINSEQLKQINIETQTSKTLLEAQLLVNRFYEVQTDGENIMDYDSAVECAKIAVDTIINSECLHYPEDRLFWQSVMKELDLLKNQE